MSATALIATLEKLYKLNKSLYDLSVKKTDVVKSGDMGGLDNLLKDEQMHVTAINTIENERQRECRNYLKSLGLLTEEIPTLSQCIEHSPSGDQPVLRDWQQKLTALLFDLKERNELNQKLVYQSLQFVNMNLSVMQPQDNQSTYNKPNSDKPTMPSRSMFDSKA
ncbi:flagellar protein FlgN [Rossellomorea aquimaris]|uniref:flagellar protein FlgN n=1 Tax=Rossellomorea aquimaris TaxID=189382 RepID=UPI001CD49FD2|nr:flagellar protein FlgN [Rossellomorea aquimaris]MCA1055293.1 flagellar protein FlgN [Rossellomorea aquimaris]